MKEITKEDVIEVVSSIDNPAVLEYLYIFVSNMKANYDSGLNKGPEKI